MKGFMLDTTENRVKTIDFNSEEDIPKLLGCEKVVSGNYYLSDYKYTIYADPYAEGFMSLCNKGNGHIIMRGDLIIVPQLGEVNDYDFSAIQAAMGSAYDPAGCKVILGATPAEN